MSEQHTHWHTGCDEARIREIVREEMSRDVKGCDVPKPKWLDDEMLAKITDAPKPKTDLERAAEIAAKESKRDLDSTPEYVVGYYHAARSIHEGIRTLKPSPDWRKIAEGLYGALFSREAKPIVDAKKAFNDAVKEQP